ncbi:hypothetical protein EI427_20080 [Flammeovirga pectinis]|uniref:Uncharacterized protein n=1 Tax=Flammeovirga pectinis TaxID=2494373 RepID=A0A3S9P8B0_9BACT|nr:DUF5916 domain-containing protein [Flammeovirga pectinis]AZQ64427.1 hypothetical protein EI427_20080 [Flammeovirga pectinis]
MNLHAWATSDAPKIDGILDDGVWMDPINVTNLTASVSDRLLNGDDPSKYIYEGFFTQNWPNNNEKSNQKTKVQVAYDDYAIYVSAQLYDTAPDSIRTNMGARDSGGNGADVFVVSFDTYNKQQDCFEFVVSASGVQSDRMRGTSGWDGNWNEVWSSAVKVNEEGWAVEMAIPYRALRMPDAKEQVWGINFGRVIQRKGETSYWNNIDANKSGYVNQFGSLRGLYDIKPPLRLSLSPYISNVAVGKQGSNKIANTFSGGADLKLGLGQSFTLDVSLVPDFSQVQADNEVLNLSAYEVQYGEFRDFFTQGTTIFNKWGQFYSRRIGQNHIAPSDDLLEEHEEYKFKPTDAPLINSIKLTGRTEKGLGIGILNSITNESFGIIEDTLTGERRDVKADPLTNFNIISIEQNLANNSKIGFMNSNVYRGQGYKNSNVTSGDFSLYDRTNTYRIRGFGGLSQEFKPLLDNTAEDEELKVLGYRYDIGGGKVSGKWRYWASTNVESDKYNPNDMGFNGSNNAINIRTNASYNIYQAKGIYQRYWARVGYDENWLYNPRSFMSRRVWADGDMLFKNFWSVYMNVATTPQVSYDYFGPREEGYRFKQLPSQDGGITINSDGRKKYSMSFRTSFWQRPEFDQFDEFYRYGQTYRMTDKFELNHTISWNNQKNEKGYVTTIKDSNDEVEDVIYGNRGVTTLENNFWTQYTFTNKMFLKLRLRHYWRQVNYTDFFDLTKDGDLLSSNYSDINDEGEKEHDTNYNTFNMEVSYSWEFLPGSFFTALWRNQLGSSSHNSHYTFNNNMNEMWKEAQVNTLSLRVMYFLDYQQVKKGFSRM